MQKMMSRPKPFKRQKIDILGVKVDDISFDKAVEAILRLAKAKKNGNVVVTVNSEFVMLARRDPKFKKILELAELALPDGQWVANSKLIMGGKEQDRVTGVDIVEKLCREGAKRAITIGFLGGFGSVAEVVSKRQMEANSGLKIVFASAGNPTIGYDSRLKRQLSRIGRVDILFVAYGMGQQEFWIERMRKKLDVGVFIGVGGAFDYLGGIKKRAPVLWQKLQIEWLWRLFAEPSRIWRMRVLPLFLTLVIFQYFRKVLKF